VVVPAPWASSWSELQLDDLVSFFGEAGDEGLTWEAKGTILISPREVRRHVCGFANQLGGYLVLGASRSPEGVWALDGVSFPGEPATWLAMLCRSGLSPQPEVDAKAWDLGNGRAVAVLMVYPSPSPPCLLDGRAHQRVTGATEPVTDQFVLAGLTQRGAAAERFARDSVAAEAARLARISTEAPSGLQRVAIAVAPLAVAPTWADRVYRVELLDLALNVLTEWSRRHPNHIAPRLATRHAIDRVEYSAGMDHMGVPIAWGVVCHENGTIGVWAERYERHDETHDVDHTTFGRPWRAAVTLARIAGLPGRGVLALSIGSAFRPNRHQLPLLDPPLLRPLDTLEDPSEEEVEKLLRRLRRARGEEVFEPS
jgi:hypothetical protein